MAPHIKCLLFDLHGTLAYVKEPIDDAKVSRLLVGHGYGVYPQAYHAAWHFVAMVDYPRHGYRTHGAFLKQVLRRCGYEVDEETLRKLGKMYRSVKWQLYPDAPRALKMAKSAGYKIGVVTTIAKFRTRTVLCPVVGEIDLHVDGFTYGCEKSNPRIYTKAMEDLGVRASETLMVGDELELDVILPKRLGMSALLLDRNKQYGPSVRGADGVVRDLIEAVNFADSFANPNPAGPAGLASQASFARHMMSMGSVTSL